MLGLAPPKVDHLPIKTCGQVPSALAAVFPVSAPRSVGGSLVIEEIHLLSLHLARNVDVEWLLGTNSGQLSPGELDYGWAVVCLLQPSGPLV